MRNQSRMKFSVKLPLSGRISGAMTSAGIGPPCSVPAKSIPESHQISTRRF